MEYPVPDPLEVEEASIDHLFSDDIDHFSYTLYVDPTNGSDTNTGYSESEALATVQKAVDRLPRVNPPSVDDFGATIKIQNGETVDERITLKGVPYPLYFRSFDPAGTNPTWKYTGTISEPSTGFLDVHDSYIDIDDIDFSDSQGRDRSLTFWFCYAQFGENVNVTSNASNGVIYAGRNTKMAFDGTLTGYGDYTGLFAHTGYIRLNGTVDNFYQGMKAYRGGVADVGLGATVKNCTYGVRAAQRGIIKVRSSTFTGNTTRGQLSYFSFAYDTFVKSTAYDIDKTSGGKFEDMTPVGEKYLESSKNLEGGLQGFWGLEQNGQASTATTAYDSSPQGNDGTLNSAGTASAMWETDSEKGVVLGFDSADNEYVDCGNIGLIESYPFSIVAVFKTSTSGVDQALFSEGADVAGNPNVFLRLQTDDTLEAYLRNDAGDVARPSTSETVADGEWHVAVFVSRASDDHELFLDGVSRATSTASVTQPISVDKSVLGARYSGGSFDMYHDGHISSVYIYNRALSVNEVRCFSWGWAPTPTGHLALK